MYRVLVLDEDRSARYVFRRFPWRRFGFAVPEAAASGQEALEWLGEKKIDLLVADIRLPDMDGIEFLEAVQAKGEHVCTVLLSSYRDFSYAQQGIRLGVFDYLTKPFSAEAFGSLLQRAAIFLHRQQGVPTETMEKDTAREFLSSEHQERLELLLFSGSPEFLPACRQLQQTAAVMPPDERRLMLSECMDEICRSFDRRFPWVRNLEEDEGSAAVVAADFMTRAGVLFSQVRRYELADARSLLRALCEQVQSTLEHDVSLHGAAAALGISADYAGRLFKRRTGVNFAAFVMRMKMERGKELLAASKARNYEIRARLGYSNPDYFRQLFKAYTGMTPTEYRQLYRSRTFH